VDSSGVFGGGQVRVLILSSHAVSLEVDTVGSDSTIQRVLEKTRSNRIEAGIG